MFMCLTGKVIVLNSATPGESYQSEPWLLETEEDQGCSSHCEHSKILVMPCLVC